MRALAVHLPFMVVMLGATVSVFIIAASHPQWFNQSTTKRAILCTLEGIVCALVWVVVKFLIEQALGIDDFLNPAVAGLAWGGMSFYGKTRFKADMYAAEKQRLNQIFRR